MVCCHSIAGDGGGAPSGRAPRRRVKEADRKGEKKKKKPENLTMPLREEGG